MGVKLYFGFMEIEVKLLFKLQEFAKDISSRKLGLLIATTFEATCFIFTVKTLCAVEVLMKSVCSLSFNEIKFVWFECQILSLFYFIRYKV